MSRPITTHLEMPWELEGRVMWISGDVDLRHRWASVDGFRCLDEREDDVELPNADRDVAEETLIDEARKMWGTP